MPARVDCGHSGPKSARGLCLACAAARRAEGGRNGSSVAKKRAGRRGGLSQAQAFKVQGGMASTRTKVKSQAAGSLGARERLRMLGSAEQPVSLHMRQHAFLAVSVLLTLSPSPVPVFLELFSGTGGFVCGSGALGWILTQMGRSARGRVRSHCGCKRCSNPSVAARGTYLGCALRHGMQVMVNCTPRGNTIKETHLGKSASVTSRPTQSGGGQRSVASEHEHTPRMLAFPHSSGL